jgi:hypothetical protein
VANWRYTSLIDEGVPHISMTVAIPFLNSGDSAFTFLLWLAATHSPSRPQAVMLAVGFWPPAAL